MLHRLPASHQHGEDAFVVEFEDLRVRAFVMRQLLRGLVRTLPAGPGRLIVYPIRSRRASHWPLHDGCRDPKHS